MQKTDWNIHTSSPSYAVLDVTNRETITTIFLYIGPFLACWPTKQPDDPSASPILTSVRKQSFAVFDRSSCCFGKKVPQCQMPRCQMWSLWHLRPFKRWRCKIIFVLSYILYTACLYVFELFSCWLCFLKEGSCKVYSQFIFLKWSFENVLWFEWTWAAPDCRTAPAKYPKGRLAERRWGKK